jgi:hypothetical protein
MSELNQKEVNEQMYLFVKRWLDNLPFEERKKTPVMAIGYCLARLSKQDELLKEQEDALEQMRLDNTDLRNCNAELLKEQEPKLVRIDEDSVHCPSCGNELFTYPRQKFCDECGQAVKWDG